MQEKNFIIMAQKEFSLGVCCFSFVDVWLLIVTPEAIKLRLTG
jgi:hypothetical protein